MKLATSLENLQQAFNSKNFRFVRLHHAKETQDITQHIPQTPSASSQCVSWNDLNGEIPDEDFRVGQCPLMADKP
ncbi:hypothetical protein V6Z11_A03G024100 [Gossypium hirsutum]|uniref:Uncharacterized protein n=2 Tax=Gossypium TaxID=3633 RepID=A0A5D2R2Q2_GOSTO|nr:hypothetical protein ES288_A03G023900v1 [Gossypium darwinii]TYI34652.1 hypothetical protein ES332_A03G023500v1 [Gossypium tomentosum]